MNITRSFIVLLLFIVLLSGVDAVSASQSSQKNGSLVVNVTWGDMNNTPANDVYVAAYAYVNKYDAYKSFVLKMSHEGQYEISLPPGTYDVFVSESSSMPRCRRLLIRPGLPSYWTLKLEIDDVYMGNAAGAPTIIKH
jgi:hypothetical protein